MHSLEDIFRGSSHNSTVFSPEAVAHINSIIISRNTRPFIRCLIRNKDIRLTPEEAVRQLFIYELTHREGYAQEHIKLEYPITIGRETKRADIVILRDETPFIIIEVKKPRLQEGKEQLKSYCNASGVSIGVWTNGEELSCYHRKAPNIFEAIDRIPKASETLHDVLAEQWTIYDLEHKDRLRDGRKSLKALIQEMEDEVLANAGVDAFEEVFKLIYTKLYDEMQSARDKKRYLEFRNSGGDDEEADRILKRKIQALFDQAKAKWPGVFDPKAEITLMPSHLAVCVSTLQDVKLFNSSLDVVDDAFEYLMNKSQKGEKGQFFTPRYVIDMCVRMLNPQKHEYMIDTAAGSCGFPVHTMFYVWRSILSEKGINQSNLFTAEKKPPECEDYVREKVFAIDFDEKAVRVARTLNLIAGDGRTNVLHLNTLDYGSWEQVTNNFAWQSVYFEGWRGLRGRCAVDGSYRDFMFDIVMANPPFAGDIKEGRIISRYELGKNTKGKFAVKVGRDILFIERNLQFLKPGGRMAIILPQGRFNNSSDKYIRDFISEQCRILAVIGLHENVFKPHTGTKTSVLLVQKWDDELCPRREDYPIFFATMRKPSKDNSGEKIYRKDSSGWTLTDEHNHPIVEHDLYNHYGLTEDGIAEAFIEFAKREGFSFFGVARLSRPFDEERYAALLDGLEICEVMLGELENNFTLGAEYYGKGYVETARRVAECAKTSTLGDMSLLITDGDHGSPEYVTDGVPYLVSEAVEQGYIDTSKIRYITPEKHAILSRSVLHPRDVIVTKTGVYFGKSAVMPDDMPEANTSSHVGKIVLKKGYNPYFVSAFLNSRFGYYQLRRRGIKATRPEIALLEFADIVIPKLSEEFEAAIEDITRRGIETYAQSTAAYTAAQSLLTSEIGHVQPDTRNITTQSLSHVFMTGRLDAEYFMPKYDDLLANIKGAQTVGDTCQLHTANYAPEAGKQYSYIELADIGTYGDITRTTTADGYDLPTRARRIVHTGQVIISSIEGSSQCCALITDGYDGALCSTGFYVISSEVYNPETLMMLFKSELVQEFMKRGCSGTILASISEEELRKIRLPFVARDTQDRIARMLQKSFSLRQKSRTLINAAVKSIELAIEYNEPTAINFITKEEFLS